MIAAGMPAGSGQRVAPEKETPGCVWKLGDGDNTVYVAGSVHLLREDDFPLPEVFDVAYEDSSELVFEVDMALLSGPEAIATMKRLGTFPLGERLSDHLGEDTYARLQDYLLSRRLPAATFDRLKPGLVFLTISSLEAMRLGARADLGLETRYYQRADEDGKPSRGLETIEFQLSRFDELTEKEVDQLLRDTLEDIDEMPDLITELIEAWKSGSTRELDKLLNEQFGKDDRVRELLLTDRNRNWVPEIEKALAGKKNIMFIVGAAHLVGKDSVIDLLRKKGYRVEKLQGSKQDEASKALKKAA
jgi:uncharacterized protein YbaP (TraB family)